MGIYSLCYGLARVRKSLVFVMWNSQWAGLSCGQIHGSVLFGWCCLSFSCINNREKEWEMRKFGPVFVHLLGKGASSFITCFVGEVLALMIFIPRARWCYEALLSHLIQNCERQTGQSHHPPPSQTLLLFIFRGFLFFACSEQKFVNSYSLSSIIWWIVINNLLDEWYCRLSVVKCFNFREANTSNME